jgi:hypothetical protein
VHFALSVAPGALNRLRERLDDLDVAHRGPVEHPAATVSLHIEDPSGNIVEDRTSSSTATAPGRTFARGPETAVDAPVHGAASRLP